MWKFRSVICPGPSAAQLFATTVCLFSFFFSAVFRSGFSFYVFLGFLCISQTHRDARSVGGVSQADHTPRGLPPDRAVAREARSVQEAAQAYDPKALETPPPPPAPRVPRGNHVSPQWCWEGEGKGDTGALGSWPVQGGTGTSTEPESIRGPCSVSVVRAQAHEACGGRRSKDRTDKL